MARTQSKTKTIKPLSNCVNSTQAGEGAVMAKVYIKSAPVARTFIGQKVYWDEVGPRHIFLRDGKLEDVQGLNICIDGDWKLRKRLHNLRTYPMGGEWARHKGARDEADS